ncbi:S-adenosyl-L-methionine-dependent methyltransferase, partial [Stipitochalara longipes BDJ]
RLDLQHHLIGLVLDNNLFLAPLQNPKKILDQGTGTGIHANNISNLAANSCDVVIGTDLSSIQPSSIPKNCYFEIDNINLPWTDQANSVDFVFSRFGNGFSDKNWDHYLSESFNCLAPGGWAEVQDMDFAAFLNDTSDPQDSMMNHWQQLICEGASNANINMRISSATLKTKFENAGFTNVQVVDKIIPMGKWPKDRKLAEIGMFQLANFLVGLEAFSLAILQRHLGWAYEEVTLYIYQLRKHVESGTLHWCWPFFVVYGQKPAND